MKTWGILAASFTALVMTAAPVAAQRLVPDKGMFAVGLSAGAALSNDDTIGNGPFLGATAEGYLTPRLSVRAQFGGAWWDITGHAFDGTVRPMHLTGNLVYNWEHGKWHPYVTGGAGMYRYRFEENDIDSTTTKGGIDAGGGIEYFFSRRDALTGELLIHVVPDDARSALSTYKSGYWTIAAGYKKYF